MNEEVIAKFRRVDDVAVLVDWFTDKWIRGRFVRELRNPDIAQKLCGVRWIDLTSLGIYPWEWNLLSLCEREPGVYSLERKTPE